MPLRSATSVAAPPGAMGDAAGSSVGLVVALVLAAAVLRPASALNCYLCRYPEDASCATNPQKQGDCDKYLAENVPQGNSTKNTTHCISLVYTSHSGYTFTERMCVPVPDKTNPCVEALKLGIKKIESCHICTEDLCNSCGRNGSMQIFYVLLLYYKWRFLLT